MYDTNLQRDALRAQLHDNHRKLLCDDGLPCCSTMLCAVYACSRSFLWPNKKRNTYESRGDASAERNPQSRSIYAWFESLVKDLDVMPDEGWYMLPEPRKHHVWENYMADCDCFPMIYTKCSRQWFQTIWNKHFPFVRIRKHCRFAKCSFCVKWREVSRDYRNSALKREESRQRLAAHRDWAVTAERGFWHAKKAKALLTPSHYISLSIDGTQKLPNGFPAWFETTKADDRKGIIFGFMFFMFLVVYFYFLFLLQSQWSYITVIGVRLKLHIEICMVHGGAPRVFLAWENIAGDPNLIIEVLTRVLQHEETARGGLPDTLFLQVDNCARETRTHTLLSSLRG